MPIDHVAETDEREYGGAAITSPAMSEDQFWHDEERLIKEKVLMTPEILVTKMLELEQRIETLERARDG